MSLADRLQRLADEHARQIDSLVEQANAAVRDIYADAAKDGDGLARLRTGLTRAVEGARKSAHALATGHALEELRMIAGDDAGRISVSMGPTPARTDVDQYIANAVQAAKESGFVETTYRGETIVESETIETYTEGRTAAEASIAAVPRSEADRIGFRVARSEAELRTLPNLETRDNEEGSIPLIAKAWSAINDRRTCAICRDLDGKRALLTQQFDGQNAPAHARCRCITHLTSVGYVKTEKAMRAHTTAERTLHFDVEVRATAVQGKARTVSVVASDETLDGHGSIIRAAGWDLTRYRKNPVVLWAHRGSCDADPKDVLGTGDARIDGSQLLVEIQFPPEGVNDQADLVYRQMVAKVIRGVSVGFRPLEYHFENEGGDNEILIVDRAELVEVSVVPVPSNSNALARSVRAFAVECAPDCGCHPAGHTGGGVVMDPVKEATPVLPPPIAALLGVDSIEAARGAIAALQLRADESGKRADAEKTRADAAEKALSERIDADTRAVVDGMVKAGRISEAVREAALTLARADIGAFRTMYPEQAADAPRRDMLTTQVVPPVKPAPAAKPLEVTAADIQARVQKYVEFGESFAEAHTRVLADLAKKG